MIQEATVTVQLARDEAAAVWAYLHQYFPESQDAWGRAICHLGDAMEVAGVDTELAYAG